MNTRDTDFLKQSTKAGITTIARRRLLLKDKTIRIIANSNGHNYGSVGETVKLDNMEAATMSASSVTKGFKGGNSINFRDFYIVDYNISAESLAEEKKILRKKIKDIEKEIDKIDSKVAWMKEVGASVFNDNEFKVFRTLTLLEDPNLSKIKRTKLISKLIVEAP